ncbi:hypothetical protein ACTHQY_14870 [Rhodococcoides corynebacterioides]|uniref:hypothetical protein n=1 Tax=Rhodococcoides corynebacterioides TaxID=53972 RepID=UPI003F802D2C
MPESHEISFEQLRGGVTVTYDETTEQMSVAVDGATKVTAFVGVLEPVPGPEVVDAEPIVEPDPPPSGGTTTEGN